MQMDMEKPQIVELAAHGVSNSLDSHFDRRLITTLLSHSQVKSQTGLSPSRVCSEQREHTAVGALTAFLSSFFSAEHALLCVWPTHRWL